MGTGKRNASTHQPATATTTAHTRPPPTSHLPTLLAAGVVLVVVVVLGGRLLGAQVGQGADGRARIVGGGRAAGGGAGGSGGGGGACVWCHGSWGGEGWRGRGGWGAPSSSAPQPTLEARGGKVRCPIECFFASLSSGVALCPSLSAQHAHLSRTHTHTHTRPAYARTCLATRGRSPTFASPARVKGIDRGRDVAASRSQRGAGVGGGRLGDGLEFGQGGWVVRHGCCCKGGWVGGGWVGVWVGYA